MKYIKKNHKEDEKKVMSTRVRSIVFDAFQNASEAANGYGYSISLSNVVETALKETIAELAEVCGIDYLDEEHKKLQKSWDEAFEKEMEEYKQQQIKGRIIFEIKQCMKFFKDSQIFSEEEISEIKPGVESYMGVLYSDKYKGGRDGQIARIKAEQKAELEGDSLTEYSVWMKNYSKDIDDYVDANIENDLDENALTAKKFIDQLSTKTLPGSNNSRNKKEKS
jgi:hypothetical protein